MARGSRANREAAAAVGVATETLKTARKRAPRKVGDAVTPHNLTERANAEAAKTTRRGAPSRYTVQMSLILDAETGGALRADIAQQQKLDPSRTQAVVLREIFDRGRAELKQDWEARGYVASTRARNAAIAAASAPRQRGGTLRAARERVNSNGGNADA